MPAVDVRQAPSRPGGGERLRRARAVVQPVDARHRRARLLDRRHAPSVAPVRPSCGIPPLCPSASTQRIVAGRDALREPRDADLALAAGEAAERRDVDARAEHRARGARLARHGDRAAAVGRDVRGRRGRARRVRRRTSRRRPARRRCRPWPGRPPGTSRSSRGRASAPTSSPAPAAAPRARRPSAALRSRAVSAIASVAAASTHTAAITGHDQLELTRQLGRATASSVAMPATTAAGASTRAVRPRPASCAAPGADERGGERRQRET